jgi:hypothetical protein
MAGSRKRAISVAGAAASLILLGIGWYVGSPRYALGQMKAAAEAGDMDRLAEYIDFPALRGSLKEEFKAKMAAEFTKPGADGLGAFGAAIAMPMIDGMVDGMVTPATMRKVFLQNKEGSAEGITKVDAAGPDLTLTRDGLDRFRLKPADQANTGSLMFTRHGLGWKLAGMRLPND